MAKLKILFWPQRLEIKSISTPDWFFEKLGHDSEARHNGSADECWPCPRVLSTFQWTIRSSTHVLQRLRTWLVSDLLNTLHSQIFACGTEAFWWPDFHIWPCDPHSGVPKSALHKASETLNTVLRRNLLQGTFHGFLIQAVRREGFPNALFFFCQCDCPTSSSGFPRLHFLPSKRTVLLIALIHLSSHLLQVQRPYLLATCLLGSLHF